MTTIARPLARPARADSRGRTLRLALGALLAACLLLLAAAPAGAVVTEVEGTHVGLQPRTSELNEPSGKFANSNGNAVVSGANVYVVYWDPGAWFHHEWVTNVDTFMEDLGAGSGEFGTIFAALGQYRDRSNAQATYHFVFKGSYSDTAPYPTAKCTDPAPLEFQLEAGQGACLTDAQVREQLQSFIATHGTEKGMHAIYYVLTPPGVAVCLTEASTHCSDYSLSAEEIEEGERASTSYADSFCSYHGDINPDAAAQGDANTILYAAIPWSAGYEGHPWDYFPDASQSGAAYDCQDGGWNPEGNSEQHEQKEPLTKAQKEAIEKLEGTAREEAEEKYRLTAPHIEEPNQEGKGEEGDDAPGLSDVLVDQIAVEQANIVTDPLLTSWQNPGTGFEATDECRDVFGSTASPSAIGGKAEANVHTQAGSLSNELLDGHDYYINNVVNNGDAHGPGGCVGGVGLVPRFTSPNPVNAGEVVGFDGMESTVSELKGAVFGPSGPPSTTYATFAWNFGDGTGTSGYAPGAPTCEAPWLSPCAASVFHAYQYGGVYTVTLTITDVAGNKAVVSHAVSVAGPPPPPPSPTAAPGSSGSSGSSSGSKGGRTAPPPVAAAAVLSHSLRKIARKGLVVNYSVNEQVAGHFEVMVSQALARRLKLGGAPAVGLPAGTPPQVVIAKAILVTTRAGHSTIVIHFSRHVAQGLERAGRVALMLRLIVRNAATESPQTTTVLSSVTLGR